MLGLGRGLGCRGGRKRDRVLLSAMAIDYDRYEREACWFYPSLAGAGGGCDDGDIGDNDDVGDSLRNNGDSTGRDGGGSVMALTVPMILSMVMTLTMVLMKDVATLTGGCVHVRCYSGRSVWTRVSTRRRARQCQAARPRSAPRRSDP